MAAPTRTPTTTPAPTPRIHAQVALSHKRCLLAAIVAQSHLGSEAFGATAVTP